MNKTELTVPSNSAREIMLSDLRESITPESLLASVEIQTPNWNRSSLFQPISIDPRLSGKEIMKVIGESNFYIRQNSFHPDDQEYGLITFHDRQNRFSFSMTEKRILSGTTDHNLTSVRIDLNPDFLNDKKYARSRTFLRIMPQALVDAFTNGINESNPLRFKRIAEDLRFQLAQSSAVMAVTEEPLFSAEITEMALADLYTEYVFDLSLPKEASQLTVDFENTGLLTDNLTYSKQVIIRGIVFPLKYQPYISEDYQRGRFLDFKIWPDLKNTISLN